MKISVVIPLYNKEKSIKNTIRSVVAQTVTDFELLVINDGSTDTSREIVAGIHDSRIRIVDKPNGGISSSRNEGIMLARHDYIAFLDADDHWEPDFLETIKGLITDYPDADCYATGYACKYSNATLNVFGANKRGIIRDFFKQVYKGPVMHSSSICVKKSTFTKVGYFNTTIRRGEDYDMWARLGRAACIAATPEVKVWYRLDAENSAMAAVHKPQVLWLYNIPPESYKDEDQKKYYRRFLHRQVLEYFIKGKFKWAWQIASHNWKVAGWYSYLLFPGNIQFRQFISWGKLLVERFSGGKNNLSSR
ncbi:glycosyltransferase family 2 protein [Agriterribacter humi]|uniref:glycosyltransferase family 2 protein n=1 Tax=Agriterribacter humi TaxID=1104781 RepID=UPI001265A3C3|nr:glycosyltransferase family 2 protein [Agriterribacter humi]